MREWRKSHRLKGIARRKSNARSYANVYLARGKIERGPCADCGTTAGVQMHHKDYRKPTEVTWLCRKCHLARHGIRGGIRPRYIPLADGYEGE